MPQYRAYGWVTQLCRVVTSAVEVERAEAEGADAGGEAPEGRLGQCSGHGGLLSWWAILLAKAYLSR